MSGFTGTLQGDGPARFNGALERRRISHFPSPYTWNPTGTPTRSASPELPSNEQRRKELRDLQFQQRRQLFDERAASLPLNQFLVQVKEEKERIWYADPRTNWMDKISTGGTEEIKAIETIKKRWVEQGIWKDKWDTMAAGRYMDIGLWKHEEPLELEPESETDTEAEPLPSSFDIFGMPHKYLKIKRPKSDEEKIRIAERRVVREREREASRPYYQFLYQISKERERIQDESADKESADAPHINTKSYENVKNSWTKREIWITKWGILPGILWKREESLDEAINNLAPIPANLFVNSSHDAEEAPTRRIFAPLFPVVPNDHQISSIVNTSQQGPSADVDCAKLENGDTERSPSASNLPRRPRTGKRVPTGQALRPSRKQPQTVSIPPRRSKRLRALGPSIANGPTGVTSTDSLKSIAGSRPKRNCRITLPVATPRNCYAVACWVECDLIVEG
ncbi:hypothetical protein B0O99DRAFT_599837 [Bisporella sp. PMI_857]|nr:hypothetical protein B0O99DRAFT_599837 [Bisporella sp. PMI_857]